MTSLGHGKDGTSGYVDLDRRRCVQRSSQCRALSIRRYNARRRYPQGDTVLLRWISKNQVTRGVFEATGP